MSAVSLWFSFGTGTIVVCFQQWKNSFNSFVTESTMNQLNSINHNCRFFFEYFFFESLSHNYIIPKKKMFSLKPTRGFRTSRKKNENDSKTLDMNQVNMISVSRQLVFIRDSGTDSFHSKITLENQTPRYVSYAVRSSDTKKFKIQDNYSFLPPYERKEVLVITKGVKHYREIAKSFFGVFAVPIYDKRQLRKGKLRLLWNVHGTDLFPSEATEFHKIPLVYPLTDDYFQDLSILGRLSEICIGSPLARSKQLMKEKQTVDEETFLLHWPKQNLDQYVVDDPSLELIMDDWHRLSHKINAQKYALIQSWKMIIGMTFSVVGMSFFILSDISPFKN